MIDLEHSIAKVFIHTYLHSHFIYRHSQLNVALLFRWLPFFSFFAPSAFRLLIDRMASSTLRDQKIIKDSVGERKVFCLVHAYKKAWKNLDEKYSKQTIYSRAERQASHYQRFCSLQRMRILSRFSGNEVRTFFFKFFRHCVGIWHDSTKQIADYIFARNW